MRSWLVVVALGLVGMSAAVVRAQPTAPARSEPGGRAQPQVLTQQAPAPAKSPSTVVDPPMVTSFGLETVEAPQIKIPLAARDGVTGIAAELAFVALDDKPKPSKLAGFGVAVRNSTLEISVRFDLVREPGVYGLQLRLTGTGGGADRNASTIQQMLAIQLVLSPARLRAIPALVVTSYRTFGDPTVSATITLVEFSHVTGLTNLHIEQLDRATESNAQIDATLTGKAPTQLPAGGRARVQLDGDDFPIGTTTGQLTITADQLSEAVVVAYEVRSKRYPGLMIPWFILFGLIGWVVRHWLKDAEARAELRARLEPLRIQARRQFDTHPDPDQIRALKTLDADVERALIGRDQAVLVTKVEALHRGLEDALSSRAAFVNACAREISELKQAVTPAWKLPDNASPSALLGQLAVAETALIADRPKESSVIVDRVYLALGDIGERVNSWRDRGDRTLRDASIAFVPASVRSRVVAAMSTAQQKVEAVPLYDRTQPPKPMAMYLRAVHQAYESLVRLTALLRDGVIDATRATAAMAKKVGKQESDVDAIAKAGAIVELPDDPVAGFAKVSLAMREFHEAVQTQIIEQESRKLLEEGRYADAMQMDATLTKGVDSATPISSKARASEEPLERAEAPATTPEVSVGGFVISMPRQVDPVSLAFQRLRGIRIVGGTISALALSLATWAVYRASWWGTLNDFVGIAVVAFFTDFTIDAVVQAVTVLKKPTMSA